MKKIIEKMMPVVGKQYLKIKNNSPEIHLMVGIGLGVFAAWQFAKSYKSHDEVFEEVDSEIEEIQAREEVDKKELITTYGHKTGMIIRHYGPAVGSGLLSVGLLLRGHNVLRKREQAFVTALTLTQQAFQQYRERVVADFGEQVDEEYFYNAEHKTEIIKTKTEDGKNKKVKKAVTTIPENPIDGIYTRVFDRRNIQFEPQRSLNKLYLETVEAHFNEILQIRGWLMLNEVLSHLKFDSTTVGAVAGWALDADGDNYVDFGLNRPINQNHGDNRFFLNFNCNGTVYKHIDG